MILTDSQYKTLLDAKEIIRMMRHDPAIKKEAMDAHVLFVLLMHAYSDTMQARGEQLIDAPY